jgi:hypothetical protein
MSDNLSDARAHVKVSPINRRNSYYRNS